MSGGWIITKDHICDPKIGIADRSGTMQGDIRADKKKGNVTPFRLYDGDDELYYEGLISLSWLNGEAEYAFAPLDWGQADAGCTSMWYKNPKTRRWEEL